MAKKLLKVIRNVCVIATIILVVLNLLSITKYSILTILLPIGFYIGCVTLAIILGVGISFYSFYQYRRGNSKPYWYMRRTLLKHALKLYGENSPKYMEIEASLDKLKKRLDMARDYYLS